MASGVSTRIDVPPSHRGRRDVGLTRGGHSPPCRRKIVANLICYCRYGECCIAEEATEWSFHDAGDDFIAAIVGLLACCCGHARCMACPDELVCRNELKIRTKSLIKSAQDGASASSGPMMLARSSAYHFDMIADFAGELSDYRPIGDARSRQ